MSSGRQLLERWFDEVWGQRNVDVIGELMDPDCVIHGLPAAGPRGPAAFKLFYEPVAAAFPETRVVIDEAIESGERVAIRCTARFRTRDGRECTFTGGGMGRIRDGKMVEAWNTWDFLGLLCDLKGCGLTPDTFMEEMQRLAAE